MTFDMIQISAADVVCPHDAIVLLMTRRYRYRRRNTNYKNRRIPTGVGTYPPRQLRQDGCHASHYIDV